MKGTKFATNVKIGLRAFSILLVSFAARITIAGEPAAQSPVTLTVSVFNDASVPASVLAEAHARAASVMRQAGVDLQWLDCGGPGPRIANSGCSAIIFPRHVSVRLVSKAIPPKADVFGQSFQNEAGEGSYAVVYYLVLAASRAAQRLRTGDLLGLVISHELGHLLLGKDSHSHNGLMAAMWQTPELREAAEGKLFFSPDQSDRMRLRYFMASVRPQTPSERPLIAASGK